MILVTGASGFVGRVLCARLAADGAEIRKVLRRGSPGKSPGPADIVVDEIGPTTNWGDQLAGTQAVVHLAARVHVMRETVADPLAEFRRVNVQGTENLARAAVKAGVARFVFVSTIKVNGEATGSRPFSEADTPNPQDAYALSKWEAEQALARVAAETGLRVIILRPPLVYGPDVKGNFLSLMNLVGRGVPLPLASIENRRSLLYVGNLADAIVRCLNDERAVGRTYLVSDGEDVSTPELIRRLSVHFDRRPRLLRFPVAGLEAGCKLLGRGSAYERLAGSLQLDSRAISAELGWNPRFNLDQGLRETVNWFRYCQ